MRGEKFESHPIKKKILKREQPVCWIMPHLFRRTSTGKTEPKSFHKGGGYRGGFIHEAKLKQWSR